MARTAWLVLLAAMACSFSIAQTASISGTVRDAATGAPVARAVVSESGSAVVRSEA